MKDTIEITNVELGKRIRELRGEMSLDKLGEMSGVSKSNISRVERGLIDVRYSTLEKLCDGLGIGVMGLVNREGIGEKKMVWKDKEERLKYLRILWGGIGACFVFKFGIIGLIVGVLFGVMFCENLQKFMEGPEGSIKVGDIIDPNFRKTKRIPK